MGRKFLSQVRSLGKQKEYDDEIPASSSFEGRNLRRQRLARAGAAKSVEDPVNKEPIKKVDTRRLMEPVKRGNGRVQKQAMDTTKTVEDPVKKAQVKQVDEHEVMQIAMEKAQKRSLTADELMSIVHQARSASYPGSLASSRKRFDVAPQKDHKGAPIYVSDTDEEYYDDVDLDARGDEELVENYDSDEDESAAWDDPLSVSIAMGGAERSRLMVANAPKTPYKIPIQKSRGELSEPDAEGTSGSSDDEWENSGSAYRTDEDEYESCFEPSAVEEDFEDENYEEEVEEIGVEHTLDDLKAAVARMSEMEHQATLASLAEMEKQSEDWTQPTFDLKQHIVEIPKQDKDDWTLHSVSGDSTIDGSVASSASEESSGGKAKLVNRELDDADSLFDLISIDEPAPPNPVFDRFSEGETEILDRKTDDETELADRKLNEETESPSLDGETELAEQVSGDKREFLDGKPSDELELASRNFVDEASISDGSSEDEIGLADRNFDDETELFVLDADDELELADRNFDDDAELFDGEAEDEALELMHQSFDDEASISDGSCISDGSSDDEREPVDPSFDDEAGISDGSSDDEAGISDGSSDDEIERANRHFDDEADLSDENSDDETDLVEQNGGGEAGLSDESSDDGTELVERDSDDETEFSERYSDDETEISERYSDDETEISERYSDDEVDLTSFDRNSDVELDTPDDSVLERMLEVIERGVRSFESVRTTESSKRVHFNEECVVHEFSGEKVDRGEDVVDCGEDVVDCGDNDVGKVSKIDDEDDRIGITGVVEHHVTNEIHLVFKHPSTGTNDPSGVSEGGQGDDLEGENLNSAKSESVNRTEIEVSNEQSENTSMALFDEAGCDLTFGLNKEGSPLQPKVDEATASGFNAVNACERNEETLKKANRSLVRWLVQRSKEIDGKALRDSPDRNAENAGCQQDLEIAQTRSKSNSMFLSEGRSVAPKQSTKYAGGAINERESAHSAPSGYSDTTFDSGDSQGFGSEWVTDASLNSDDMMWEDFGSSPFYEAADSPFNESFRRQNQATRVEARRGYC